MPQVLKDEVRERILEAALEVFAAHGFLAATMAMIAERAGVGTASMYRYYASKTALFDAVISPEFAHAFESLLERRVRALAEGTRRGGDFGNEMLRFWMEHRLAVVILLDRAEGTPYAHFGGRFVEQLVEQTLAQLRKQHPEVRLSAPARFVLNRIFENTRRALASILEHHDDERSLREAVETFWSYQIAGIRGLARHLAQ
jgi:AcrR family transcriptional regulator